MANKYTYSNAEVLKIIDGDTIDLLVDLGFDIWKKIRVRLYGINAPETRGEERELGLTSKEFLANLIPVGSYIMFDCLGQDKYGRWLGILYKDELNLNDLMVEENHAVIYMC